MPRAVEELPWLEANMGNKLPLICVMYIMFPLIGLKVSSQLVQTMDITKERKGWAPGSAGWRNKVEVGVAASYIILQGRIENDHVYLGLDRHFRSSMLESLDYVDLSYLECVGIVPIVCHNIVVGSKKYR